MKLHKVFEIRIARYFLLLIIICENLIARDGKSEITLGYGLLTTAHLIALSADVRSTGLSAGMAGVGRKHSGAFHIGYRYYGYNTQNLPEAIGGIFLYEQAQSEALAGNTVGGRFDDRFYTLMGKINCIYFDFGKLTLYGAMARGISIWVRQFTANDGRSDISRAVRFNLQLVPAGIKYGDKLGMYAEAGWGSQGIVCAGVFMRL